MGCVDSDFAQCFVDLVIPQGDLFPVLDNQELDTLCDKYTDVNDCIQNSIDLCSQRQKVRIFSELDVLKFLCTTGYEGYKKARSCISKADLLQEVNKCNSTFTLDMGQVQNMQEQTYTQKKQHICSCMSSLIGCIRDSASQICGREEADWIYSMKNRMMSGTMAEIGCVVTSKSMPTILAISIAVFIAIVVIILASFLIYKKIKSEDKKHQKSAYILTNSAQKASFNVTSKSKQGKTDSSPNNKNGTVQHESSTLQTKKLINKNSEQDSMYNKQLSGHNEQSSDNCINNVLKVKETSFLVKSDEATTQRTNKQLEADNPV